MAMQVKETVQICSKQFEGKNVANPAVTNAVRKQYLETARGHYLSALAGLNAGKLERTDACHNIDAISVSEDISMDQATEAEPMCILEELEPAKTFAEMDIRIPLRNGVLKPSDKRLQAIKEHFKNNLAKNTNEKISEMISKIGVCRQEMENVDISESQDSMIVISELGSAKESLLKGVVDGSSLQKMVKSLKVELENLKKEHAELKDNGGGGEFATMNLRLKLLKSESKSEGLFSDEPEVGPTFEGTTRNQLGVENLNIKDKGLKRENDSLKLSEEVEKRQRVALYADEAKEAVVCAPDQSKDVPGKTYDACVSTSESSARIIFPEDELESSSQKVEKSDKLDKGALPVLKGRESAKYDHSSEFSIRDYVFAARSRDISMNWPFSQKNLQLCLKHGVKNVLPPFQPVDSLRECSMKRCLADTSLHSEESNLDGKPLVLKNCLVSGTSVNHRWDPELTEGYRDLDSFPSVGEKESVFKKTAMTNAQSEVESVSTSNLPLSEVSDELEAAASAVNNKPKSSASQLSSKKCKVAVKVHMSSFRGAADEITSACTAPSEAIASKICPVCETFSSSSNTTLNAHIDQCLSSQSTPNWMKNSNLIKPRVKPRKMRLMADICATAPCCTLEDLDRRNGTNWATNAELPSQDGEMITQGKNHGVSRHVNNGDGAVYIDSSGRKIRILSKFNDVSSSSFAKASVDLRSKKPAKPCKTSKFFSQKRNRHLAKHLKYLKVTRQRKRFSSRKVNGRSNETCETAKMSTCDEKLVKDLQPAPFVNAQEQKNTGISGTLRQSISSKRHCRQASDSVQPRRVNLDSDELHVKLLSGAPKKFPSSLRSVRARKLYRARTNQKCAGSNGRKTFCGPSMKNTFTGCKESRLMPLKLGSVQSNGKDVPVSEDSRASSASSLDRDVEFQADDVEIADSSFPGSRKFSDSPYVFPFKGSRSHNSETDLLSRSLSCVQPYLSKQKSSALEKSHGCSGDEMGDIWSADICALSGAMPEFPKVSEISNSFDRTSLIKLQGKQELKQGQDGIIDTKSPGELPDESQDNYVYARSAIIGRHNNREVISPVSSSGFAVGEAVGCLRSSSEPESHKVADVPDSQPKSFHYGSKFQGPLISNEASVLPSQSSLCDDHEMLPGDVIVPERLELETGGSDCNVGFESSFPEVDPIPIPGPPGSDLPSFSDMGSEHLNRSLSFNSSLAQSSGDGGDVAGDLSDSPLSATSTISNLGITEDPAVSEPECFMDTLPCPNNVCPGWLGACSGPMVGFAQFAATGAERVASVVDSSKNCVFTQGRDSIRLKGDNQQCSCSRKEGIPWSSTLNFEESPSLMQRVKTVALSPAKKDSSSQLNGRANCMDASNQTCSFGSSPREELESFARASETLYQSIVPMEVTSEADVSFPRAGDCDSASPAPILRLMGKDLMVVNKAKDDILRDQEMHNACTNRLVLPVSELPNRFSRSWQCASPPGRVIIGPLHQQNSHPFSVRCPDDRASSMLNKFRGPKLVSQGSLIVEKNVRANDPVLGQHHCKGELGYLDALR